MIRMILCALLLIILSSQAQAGDILLIDYKNQLPESSLPYLKRANKVHTVTLIEESLDKQISKIIQGISSLPKTTAPAGILAFGHGANLTALAITPWFDHGDKRNNQFSKGLSRIKAAILISGAYNWHTFSLDRIRDPLARDGGLGALNEFESALQCKIKECLSRAKIWSAASYEGNPAVHYYLMHGEIDDLIPSLQASRFDKKLQKQGLKVEFMLYPDQGSNLLHDRMFQRSALFFDSVFSGILAP